MNKVLAKAVIAAALSMAGSIVPAHARNIDLQLNSGVRDFDFGAAGRTLPVFSFGRSQPGPLILTDAFWCGDQFRIGATSMTGRTAFSSLKSLPSLGSYLTDPTFALKNQSVSAGGVSLSGGSHTVEAPAFGSGGVYAGLFASDSSSGGGSGGAPSPEINALLGLALAGGTVTFLRRRRRERSDPAAV